MIYDFNKGSVVYDSFGGFFYDERRYYSIEDANERLAEGLVVCERVESDNGGRLRLHKIYVRNSIERGNGWYDLFTYTRDSAELKKGFYLCRIKEFKCDKNNYVNMVVETVVYLGESITAVPDNSIVRIVRTMMIMNSEEDKPAWEFLRRKMSPIAFAPHGVYFGTYNEENAVEHGFTKDGAMERLLAGDISVLDELSALLHQPLKVEQAKEYAKENLHKTAFEQTYPLLSKKLQKKESVEFIPFFEKHLRDYEERKLEVFIPENASVAEVVLYKCEAALVYWKKVHAAQKKAKKGGNKENI